MSKETTVSVPKDLQDKVNSLKVLISIHDLLSTSKHEGFKSKRLEEAFSFISALHTQLLEDVKAHPEANKIPGLIEQEAKGE
jgi:hypothetical protein